jgi:hypothetical protein
MYIRERMKINFFLFLTRHLLKFNFLTPMVNILPPPPPPTFSQITPMIRGIWWIGWPYVLLNDIGLLQQVIEGNTKEG